MSKRSKRSTPQRFFSAQNAFSPEYDLSFASNGHADQITPICRLKRLGDDRRESSDGI